MAKAAIADLPGMIDTIRAECAASNKVIVMDLLQIKGLSVKDARAAYQQLDGIVRNKIDQIYSPRGKLTTSIEYLSPSQKNALKICAFIETKYPSLAKWIWTVWSLPHYHATGDVLGYGNEKWEFNDGNPLAGSEYTYELLNRFIELGGVNNIDIRTWTISDDTIMYLPTIELATIAAREGQSYTQMGLTAQSSYVSLLEQIRGRGGGNTTKASLAAQNSFKWDQPKYDVNNYGNGAAMRSGWIGAIRFCEDPQQTASHATLSLSVITAMITHNSAIAIWGSVTAAFFTTLAIAKIPIAEWPSRLIKLIQLGTVSSIVREIKGASYQNDFLREQITFVAKWTEYIRLVLSPWQQGRDMASMTDIRKRYQFLKDNFSKDRSPAGSGGDDVCIFAYDSVLRSAGSLEKALVLACCHPGDSDTVGCIAMSWFGGYYGSASTDRYFNRWRGQLLELDDYDQTILDLIRSSHGIVEAYYRDLYRFWVNESLDEVLQ